MRSEHLATDWKSNPLVNAHLELLHKWNPMYSLVSQRDLSNLYQRHVENSLELLPFLDQSSRHLDIGSGGGFPGIPLAIARPSMSVIVNDRSRNKCRFLRQVKMELRLENVEVLELDIKPVSIYQERFNSVTARAVGRPKVAWLLGHQFLDDNGVVLLQTTHAVLSSDVPGGEVRGNSVVGRGWISVVARSDVA